MTKNTPKYSLSSLSDVFQTSEWLTDGFLRFATNTDLKLFTGYSLHEVLGISLRTKRRVN